MSPRPGLAPSSESEPPAALDRFVLALLVGWAIFAVRNAMFSGRMRTVIVDTVMTAVCALGLALVRRWPRRWPIALHGAIGLSMLALLLSSTFGGGARSVSWWYFAAVPLLALSIASPRSGIAWSVLSAICAGVAAADPLHLTPDFVPGQLERAFAVVVLVAITTAFGWIARRDSDLRIAALTAAAREKSELLASISHEIRTPLHGVLGIASVLDGTKLTSDQRELLVALRSSGRTLNRIVDDVLDVARLESGLTSIDHAPMDLQASLEDVIDLHAAEASEKGLALVLLLEAEAPLWVQGDDVRIRQIVSNLVGNAVKFTARGSVIVRASRAPEGFIVLRVEDTGPGIPPERMDRLFVAYDRLDSKQARLHGGSGLGLALAHDLASRMGGSLRAERGRSVGSALELRLPLKKADRGSPDTPIAAQPRRVLVVEAEPLHAESARSMAATLKELEVVVVGSTALALARAKERPFDLAVICASAELDPAAALAELGPSLAGAPAVVALSPASNAADSSLLEAFSGATMRPLRRSRLRVLLDEVELVSDVSAARPRGRTALVVDDEPTNRRIMTRLLETRGWSVVTAPTGASALEKLGTRSVDLLLCDLHMPEMDGVELLLAAKRLGSTAYFAAVTASVRESDRTRCIAAGFEAFLRKPFEPSELDEVLAEATQRSRSAEPAERASVAAPVVAAPAVAEPAPDDLLDLAKWRELEGLLGDDVDAALADQEAGARAYVAAILEHPDDLAEATRAAHTLASSSLMVGFLALGRRAQALELSMRTLDVAQRRAEAEQLGHMLDGSLDAFARARGREPAVRSDGTEPGSRIRRIVFSAMMDGQAAEQLLDRALRASLPARPALLIDCRKMLDEGPTTRTALEAWLGRHHGAIARVAVLTEDRLWAAAVDAMVRSRQQAPVRVFRDEQEALVWLGSVSSAPPPQPSSPSA